MSSILRLNYPHPIRQRAFNIIEKTRTILSFSQGSDEAVDKVEGAEGEAATPAAKVTSYCGFNVAKLEIV